MSIDLKGLRALLGSVGPSSWWAGPNGPALSALFGALPELLDRAERLARIQCGLRKAREDAHEDWQCIKDDPRSMGLADERGDFRDVLLDLERHAGKESCRHEQALDETRQVLEDLRAEEVDLMELRELRERVAQLEADNMSASTGASIASTGMRTDDPR